MKRQPLKIKNAAFENENPIKVSTRQSQPHCTGSLLVILMPINKTLINRNVEKKERYFYEKEHINSPLWIINKYVSFCYCYSAQAIKTYHLKDAIKIPIFFCICNLSGTMNQ